MAEKRRESEAEFRTAGWPPPISSGLIEAAHEIALKRAEQLAELRAALEHGDDAKALTLARRLCGLPTK